MAGGFDCNFVEEAIEDCVQPECCTVCLLILRQPHQVSCCGCRYCKNCIQRIQTERMPCPTCKERHFHTFHDKGFQRSLYDVQVHCSQKLEGCEWKGELGQLDNHLNLSPQAGKQLEGCEYVKIECPWQHIGCVVRLCRKNMPDHLKENLETHMFLLAASHRVLQERVTRLGNHVKSLQGH